MDPAVPPGPDDSVAPRLLGVVTPLWGLSIIAFVARITTRSYPVQRLGWDDFFIVLAAIAGTLNYAGMVESTRHGVGRHNFYVPPEEAKIAHRTAFIGSLAWLWCILFAKVSIALMLMRIKSERSWKWFLSFFIALNIINTITANTAILVQCRPTRILWGEGDPSTAKCWTPKQSQASAYVNSAVSILTDIVFALIPITFIRKMSTPLPSRLILGILLALGLLAGAAGIVKCTYIPSLGTSKDPFRDLIDLTLWNAVEEHVCVLAACLPTLKRPCEKLLGRWGLVTSRKGSNGNLGRVSYNSSGGRGGGYLRYGEGKSGGSKSGVEGSMVDPAGSEVAIITDGRGVGKVEGIRKTTEVRFSLEDVPMGDLESARPKSLGWEGREWEPV